MGGSPFNGSGPFKSFGGGGLAGKMNGGQIMGSLIGNAGGGQAPGGGGKGGRAAAKDMSNWAFQYAHPYENDPQGRPMQEILGQLGNLSQMAQIQQQKQQWQPQLTNRQGLRNEYIQSLIRGGNGRGI